MIDAARTIAVLEPDRFCVRCGVAVHGSDGPHLCRDVVARLTAYRQQRRSYLLRLIQGRRCPKHGTVLQTVCGVKSCGMCWIEQSFRPPRATGPVEFKPPKFAGYGRKGPA